MRSSAATAAGSATRSSHGRSMTWYFASNCERPDERVLQSSDHWVVSSVESTGRAQFRWVRPRHMAMREAASQSSRIPTMEPWLAWGAYNAPGPSTRACREPGRRKPAPGLCDVRRLGSALLCGGRTTPSRQPSRQRARASDPRSDNAPVEARSRPDAEDRLTRLSRGRGSPRNHRKASNHGRAGRSEAPPASLSSTTSPSSWALMAPTAAKPGARRGRPARRDGELHAAAAR